MQTNFHGCPACVGHLVSYYLPWTQEESRTGLLKQVLGIKEVLDLAHSALKDTLKHRTHMIAKHNDTDTL